MATASIVSVTVNGQPMAGLCSACAGPLPDHCSTSRQPQTDDGVRLRWEPDASVHAKAVIESLQEAGLTGPVQSWRIEKMYPVYADRSGALFLHTVLEGRAPTS